MHLYMRTSKIPHLREPTFPFAEGTRGLKVGVEGGNGIITGPLGGPGVSPCSYPMHPLGNSQQACIEHLLCTWHWNKQQYLRKNWTHCKLEGVADLWGRQIHKEMIKTQCAQDNLHM